MEQQKVSFIQLGMSNLEVITIDTKNILSLDIDGIAEDHHILSRHSNKTLEKHKHCEYMQLVISLNANNDISLAIDKKPLKLFDRLSNWSDIVDITYLDSRLTELETINMPWRDKNDDGTENEYQRQALDNNGNLVIFIEKPSNIMSEEEITKAMEDVFRTNFYWVDLEKNC